MPDVPKADQLRSGYPFVHRCTETGEWQHSVTVGPHQPDGVVAIDRQGLHLAKRDLPQQWHDDGRVSAGSDVRRQLLRWDAIGMGDLRGQQRPAQQGIGGDGVGT